MNSEKIIFYLITLIIQKMTGKISWFISVDRKAYTLVCYNGYSKNDMICIEYDIIIL